MKAAALHRWNVTPVEAREIQIALRERMEREDRLPCIRYVAGADVAFEQSARITWERGLRKSSGRAIAGVVLYRFPELEEVERVSAVRPLRFPYVPGLLSFREAPAILAAVARLRRRPDLIFVDGHGYAHPRRFGIACHLGVLLDLPAIGVAKSLLIGTHGEPGRKAGSWAPLRALNRASESETIGAVLRTADSVRPVFVSQGHRISLETAIELVMAVADGYRIPRPTRDADHFVGAIKRGESPRVIRGAVAK
ncbi:MAG: deoxyribonuclease V [Candidatus Acidiferrales bacterium]